MFLIFSRVYFKLYCGILFIYQLYPVSVINVSKFFNSFKIFWKKWTIMPIILFNIIKLYIIINILTYHTIIIRKTILFEIERIISINRITRKVMWLFLNIRSIFVKIRTSYDFKILIKYGHRFSIWWVTNLIHNSKWNFYAFVLDLEANTVAYTCFKSLYVYKKMKRTYCKTFRYLIQQKIFNH